MLGLEKNTRGREKLSSGLPQRFRIAVASGLFTVTLLIGTPGTLDVAASQLRALHAQADAALAQSGRFLSDVRVLYQVAQLARLEMEAAEPPTVLPAEQMAGSSCKLIAAPETPALLRKPTRTRS